MVTLIICLPTLYFFDILFGSQLNFRQYTVMALTSKVVNEASEYGRLLNEALQIGTRVHQELQPFYSGHSDLP